MIDGGMTFIETVPVDDAPEAVARHYDAARTPAGTVPNHAQAFSLRPEVYAAWRQLLSAITADLDPRRYELATVAAARRIRSSYCMLAHGLILADRFLGPDAVRAVVDDHRMAGLDDVDIAVFEIADKVAGDATSVTQADVDRLRALGLSDAEILDVVLAAAVRCFYSKVLDALGVQPDPHYAELEPDLRDALTVGRPLA